MASLGDYPHLSICLCNTCLGKLPEDQRVALAHADLTDEEVNDVVTGRAGIGDVKSDARGSGARFNSGKAPVELIPVWLIAHHSFSQDHGSAKYEAWRLLRALGDWQRDKAIALEALAEFSGDWTTDCAAVFDYGRKKYAEWNWAKGMPWSVPMACAVRHCLAILRGEDIDPESGLPHRGHVACNVVMLAQYESSYPEGDDRPWRLLAPAGEKSA